MRSAWRLVSYDDLAGVGAGPDAVLADEVHTRPESAHIIPAPVHVRNPPAASVVHRSLRPGPHQTPPYDRGLHVGRLPNRRPPIRADDGKVGFGVSPV